MSHINGTGWGSSHDWRDLGSGPGYTRYRCNACGETFAHAYDDVPNIFKAMALCRITDQCKQTSGPSPAPRPPEASSRRGALIEKEGE